MQKKVSISFLMLSLYINVMNASDINNDQRESHKPQSLLAALCYGTSSRYSRIYDVSEDQSLAKRVAADPNNPAYQPTPLEMGDDVKMCACGTCALGCAYVTTAAEPCATKVCVAGGLCFLLTCCVCEDIKSHRRDVRNQHHPVYEYLPFSLFKNK